MGREDQVAELLKEGKAPARVAKELGISLSSTVGYIDRAIAAGKVRASTVLHNFPRAERESSEAQRYVEEALHELMKGILLVERKLHALIRDALETRFDNSRNAWWEKGVPESVQTRCIERWQSGKKGQPRGHAYNYAVLSDLISILKSRDEIFRAELRGPLVTDFSRLENDLWDFNSLRNAIMHPAREVGPSEADFALVTSLLEQLDDTRPRKEVSDSLDP